MKAKLSSALVEAQKAVASVAKADQNQHFNYRYASSEDMMGAARAALHAHGLALVVQRYTITPQPDATVVLEALYRLVHASGEAVVIRSITPVVPERGRPPDKAIGAAKTYDLAYTLRGLLLIPRVDPSDEVDQRDDRSYDPARGRAAPGRPRRPPRAGPPPAEPHPDSPEEDTLRAELRAMVARAGGVERARALVGPGDWPIGKVGHRWTTEEARILHAALTEALHKEGLSGDDARTGDGSEHPTAGSGDV